MLGQFLALVLAAQAAVAVVSPPVVGLWATAGDEGLVRIEACGGAICGRATGDPATEGLLIMKLRPTGPDRWGDGWIRNPDNGKTYKASISLTDDGRLRLRGCLVVPLCRTQTWTRAGRMARTSPPAPPS
jgi:uncharacterized protein (DUF2147 family)